MLRCAPPLFLIQTDVSCWKCSAPVRAVGIVANHVEDEDEDGEYVPYGDDPSEFFSLSYVTAIPDQLLAEIHAVTQHFKSATSATARQSYFANHCPSCGALQGDHYVHSEPDEGFFKTTDEGLEDISVSTLGFSDTLMTEANVGSNSGICRLLARHLGLPERRRPIRAKKRASRA